MLGLLPCSVCLLRFYMLNPSLLYTLLSLGSLEWGDQNAGLGAGDCNLRIQGQQRDSGPRWHGTHIELEEPVFSPTISKPCFIKER